MQRAVRRCPSPRGESRTNASLSQLLFTKYAWTRFEAESALPRGCGSGWWSGPFTCTPVLSMRPRFLNPPAKPAAEQIDPGDDRHHHPDQGQGAMVLKQRK